MLVGMVDLLTDGAAEDQQKIAIPNPTGVHLLTYLIRTIYSKPPHITADSYFSNEALMDWLGAKDMG